MSDTISLLRHPTKLLAKTWQAGGDIKSYDQAKYFKLEERAVDDVFGLSKLLSSLELDHYICLIRGKYIGDDKAKILDPLYKAEKVRRLLDVFADEPQHFMLVEIDDFKPIAGHPVNEPVACIEEYIRLKLPSCFQLITYHWQLSNSAGRPGKERLLKAHLWFWLTKPLTSAELRSWAKTNDIACDPSVFNPVQIHYTAAPKFEAGVVDPVPVRSGLVDGLLGDTVDLVIEPDFSDLLPIRETRQVKRITAAHNDPIARYLNDNGFVISTGAEGKFNITCPFSDTHSTPSSESSTSYFPAHTGGFSEGAFKCQHQHCSERTRHEYLNAIGYCDDDFDNLSDGLNKTPQAHHLTTHQANFDRLSTHFGNRLIFSAGHWYAWSGTHWAADEGAVCSYVCKLSKIIMDEATEWKNKLASNDEDRKANSEIAKALERWSHQSEMRSAIDAVIALARKMLAVSEDRLDKDPWALNCLNGTIDLRTGELRPHNCEDYITRLVAVSYIPEAKAEVFQTVLRQITCEDDQEAKPMADFLQRWFGYCATGSTQEQKLVVHYGLGSNGKSTLLEAIADVLGTYATTAAPGLLVSSGRDRHPAEIADLFNRRMVTAHETGDGANLREDLVKQATGSDKMKARLMRQDFFEFIPTHKLQLLTNHKPTIRGQDHAIWRRILLVPYKARFGSLEEVATGQAQYLKDTSIAEKIVKEREGILNWIIQGAVAWFRAGLNPPDVVLAASKDYRTEQDRISQFVRETCELGEEFKERFSGDCMGLYSAYSIWCKQGGFMPLAKNRFSSELERVVPKFKRIEKKVPTSGGKRRDVVFIGGVRLMEGADVGSIGL